MTAKWLSPHSNNLVLSLDFGGTKLAAGLVEPKRGMLLVSRQIPTPADAEHSLEQLVSLGHSLLDQYSPGNLIRVGVSFGGLVCLDARTVLRSHHVPGWDYFPLASRLEAEFRVPVRIANDADSAALGEYFFGAGQGVQNLLYLTVSTGIGAGIVVNGALYRGENALAGEVGHMVLLPEGPECPCGRRGCLESLASGLSIARHMRQRLAESGVLDETPGISAKSVAEAAAAGDELAISVWSAAMSWLGIGIANAANILNPGRVVLGGGLTRAGAQLFEPVRQAVARIVLDPALQVSPAALGDEAPLLGSSKLASS